MYISQWKVGKDKVRAGGGEGGEGVSENLPLGYVHDTGQKMFYWTVTISPYIYISESLSFCVVNPLLDLYILTYKYCCCAYTY